MKRPGGTFKIILLVLALFLFVRFLPLLARLVQAMATFGRAYWWVILPLLIFCLIIWRRKRRRIEQPPMRDVTPKLKE